MISGVANGLATHLGLPVFWVRAAFVVLLLGNGLGALLYAAFWFAVPMGIRADSPPTTWQYGNIGPYSLVKEPTGWRRGLRAVRQTLQGEPVGATASTAPTADGKPAKSSEEAYRGPLLALIALVAGVLVLFNTLTRQSSSPYVWPFLVAGLGVAVVWRQADDARWARWFALADGKRGAAVLRLSAGVALVVAGVVGFLIVSGSIGDFAKVAQAVLALSLIHI